MVHVVVSINVQMIVMIVESSVSVSQYFGVDATMVSGVSQVVAVSQVVSVSQVVAVSDRWCGSVH